MKVTQPRCSSLGDGHLVPVAEEKTRGSFGKVKLRGEIGNYTGIVLLIGKAKHFDSDLCLRFFFALQQQFEIHADDDALAMESLP